MKTVSVKAIIITNGDYYFLHGVSGESATSMFKTMMPLWTFDPSKETVHCIEIEVKIPEFEDTSAPLSE